MEEFRIRDRNHDRNHDREAPTTTQMFCGIQPLPLPKTVEPKYCFIKTQPLGKYIQQREVLGLL